MNTQYLSQLPFHTTKRTLYSLQDDDVQQPNEADIFLLLQFPKALNFIVIQLNLEHPVGQTAVV